MKVHCLIRSQFLPIPADVAWVFFSNPATAAQLTPPWAQLTDESYELSREIYAGLLRIYKIRLYGFFSYRWVSEITQVQAPDYFVEERKLGPLALWQHKHLIESVPDGVEVRDVIHYALPPGFLSALGGLLLRSHLERLMDYRERMLAEFFGGV